MFTIFSMSATFANETGTAEDDGTIVSFAGLILFNDESLYKISSSSCWDKSVWASVVDLPTHRELVVAISGNDTIMATINRCYHKKWKYLVLFLQVVPIKYDYLWVDSIPLVHCSTISDRLYDLKNLFTPTLTLSYNIRQTNACQAWSQSSISQSRTREL